MQHFREAGEFSLSVCLSVAPRPGLLLLLSFFISAALLANLICQSQSASLLNTCFFFLWFFSWICCCCYCVVVLCVLFLFFVQPIAVFTHLSTPLTSILFFYTIKIFQYVSMTLMREHCLCLLVEGHIWEISALKCMVLDGSMDWYGSPNANRVHKPSVLLGVCVCVVECKASSQDVFRVPTRHCFIVVILSVCSVHIYRSHTTKAFTQYICILDSRPQWSWCTKKLYKKKNLLKTCLVLFFLGRKVLSDSFTGLEPCVWTESVTRERRCTWAIHDITKGCFPKKCRVKMETWYQAKNKQKQSSENIVRHNLVQCGTYNCCLFSPCVVYLPLCSWLADILQRCLRY